MNKESINNRGARNDTMKNPFSIINEFELWFHWEVMKSEKFTEGKIKTSISLIRKGWKPVEGSNYTLFVTGRPN